MTGMIERKPREKDNFYMTKDQRPDLVESGEWKELPKNGDYNRYVRVSAVARG
jgi:hypothetical protein